MTHFYQTFDKHPFYHILIIFWKVPLFMFQFIDFSAIIPKIMNFTILDEKYPTFYLYQTYQKNMLDHIFIVFWWVLCICSNHASFHDFDHKTKKHGQLHTMLYRKLKIAAKTSILGFSNKHLFINMTTLFVSNQSTFASTMKGALFIIFYIFFQTCYITIL